MEKHQSVSDFVDMLRIGDREHPGFDEADARSPHLVRSCTKWCSKSARRSGFCHCADDRHNLVLVHRLAGNPIENQGRNDMPSATGIKRSVCAALAVGAVASAAALATAAPASAAEGSLRVCSQGSYGTSVEFPERGGLSTTIIWSGQCQDVGGFGGSSAVEEIRIFGHDGPAQFLVRDGVAQFRASKGGTVITYGTPQDNWALRPTI